MRISRSLLRAALASGLLLGVPVLGMTNAGAGVFSSGSPRATPAPPMIESTGPNVYVNDMATQYVGTPGQFTFSDPGSTVSGYYYGLFGASPQVFVPAAADGTAVLAITPYIQANLVLNVQATDGSTRSAISSFDIKTLLPAGNIATLAWWKLNAGRGKIAADAAGHLHDAALHKDASLGCQTAAAPDGYRCTMKLGGLGGQARTSPAIFPVVGNNFSFSASAWVYLLKCPSSCVALSVDATQTYEFALSYKKSCTADGKTGPCWRFSIPATDSAHAVVMTAASPPGSAQRGKWTQLTGVFDSARGELTLYVNGVQVGQVSGAGPWTAPQTGRVRIGNLIPGGSTHDWRGRISNACVFFNALDAADVMLLHTGDAAHPNNGCAALDALYP